MSGLLILTRMIEERTPELDLHHDRPQRDRGAFAALIGPFFIDWTAYRSTFEDYGERLLGHRVAVMGDAEMRLLPTPTLTFSDVRVGEPEDPLLAVSRFAVRIELPPLLKGEVRIIDMTLDEPSLRLSLDEQGRLDWFTGLNRDGFLRDVDPDLVMLERATIRDGRLSVIDARSGRTIPRRYRSARGRKVAAWSLQARWHGQPQWAACHRCAGDRRRDAEGALRLRAGITPVSVPVDLVMDGQISLAEGKPAYEGAYTLNSVVTEEGRHPLGQRGRLCARRGAAGPDGREPALWSGGSAGHHRGRAGRRLFQPLPLRLHRTAKQIDLDRIAGRGPQ
ncbi:MAG: AsmA family protein [Alphaproteobacteria bacterium]|nr:AsmA family protein [Alphaproteobacteria bacterium]